jgi:type I restriction enzyme M protein
VCSIGASVSTSFLRYADVRFTQVERELGPSTGRRQVGKADYQARGVMFVPAEARFSHLQSLPESADRGQALNRAMELIEEENPDLVGVLPRDYARIDNRVLAELLRLIGTIPDDIEGDAIGKIYEYFLGNFAMTEGQRGGEFCTPTSIVKADRGHHRAVRRPDSRPRLRFRRHVRPVGPLR